MSLPWNVELKLARAEKHASDLRVAHDEFLEAMPYDCERTIEGEIEPGLGRTHVFRWTRFTPPPDDLGLIAGDALHNARSALDHLAMSLAEQGAKAKARALTDKEVKAVQFPIAVSPDRFNELINSGCLPCVKKPGRHAIEAFQPYNVSPDPAAAQIQLLADLDNLDKHRTITPVIHVIDVGQIGWRDEIGDVTPIWFQPTTTDGHGKVGSEILRYEFAEPETAEAAHCEIRFGASLYRQPTFNAIWWQVDDMIKTVRDYAEHIAARALPETSL